MRLNIFIYTLVMLLAATSCNTDITSINQNPNEPEAVPPSVIFPYAIREGIDRIHGHRTRLERLGLDGGMLWVQYFARNQYTNEGDTYNPDASMRNNSWEGFYNEAIINFQKVIDATGDPESEFFNENYMAAALIMREYMYSIVTDVWGAIPYSEALKGAEGNLAPAYDSQEVIYESILANLKMASEMLDTEGSEITSDIIYQGDILMWKKFANSLRIRLANRQASANPSASAAIFSEIMGNPSTYPVFESVDEHALLQHSSRLNGNNNNAWHEVMVISAREDWSISNMLIEQMTDGSGNATDPRLELYAEPAAAGDNAGLYSGAPNGLPEAIASIYINTASRPGSWFTREEAPFAIMTYSELLFALAEATLEGDYTGGESALDYLQLAIAASFHQYDLEVPASYFEGMEANKETIMLEKWKALFGQGIEAWTEVRRTGLPKLMSPDVNAIFENNGIMPTRLRYPESEYSLNATNVMEGAAKNGGEDNKQTPLWWTEIN